MFFKEFFDANTGSDLIFNIKLMEIEKRGVPEDVDADEEIGGEFKFRKEDYPNLNDPIWDKNPEAWTGDETIHAGNTVGIRKKGGPIENLKMAAIEKRAKILKDSGESKQ